MKPAQHLMNKFKKNCLLAHYKYLSVKYFSVLPVFMELFSEMTDNTQMVSCMK